jgi:hypothetical protein
VHGRDQIYEYYQTSKTGLPGPHLLALYGQFAENAFPTALIAQRWIPEVNNAEIRGFPMPSIHEGRGESQSHNDDPNTEAVA